MKKRFCGFLIILAMALALLPVGAGAETVYEGTCGKNLTWELDDQGTLTISGTGNMYLYSNRSNKMAPWYAHRKDIYAVVIEDGVTSIGTFAFYLCERMTAVTIPDSVTTIGENAFYLCRKLPTVTVPDSVTSIGKYAFSGCNSLTTAKLSNSITVIEESMFALSNALTTITIPDGVTGIGKAAFYECTALKSISIPDTVTNIGEQVFYKCSGLTKVTIPQGVTNIPNSAFYSCTSLKSVEIPDGVTAIGDQAFESCTELSAVEIPNSVTEIGWSAFRKCKGLISVTIPDGVTDIDGSVFRDCKSLTSVTIPDSVTSIDDYAFYACTAIKDVYYGGKQEQWDAIWIGSANECLTNATIHFAGAETALIAAARLDVGNSLSMQFAVPKAKLANWAGTYAQIDHTRSDGSVKTTKIPYEQWMIDSASPDYLVISYSGVAAKEMTDELEVSIYNAAGQQLGATYTDSIRGYVMRNFGKFGAKVDRLFADMLNYGAEAQIYFKNKTNDLANAQMNATQRGYATQTDPAVTNTATSGIQARLDLQYKIALQIAIPAAYKNQTITYSFTNQKGVFSGEIPVNVRTEGDMSFIIVDAIVVGDARQTVIVKANGVEILHDSVESYIARMSSSNNMAALCKAIMKFADAARDYFK